MSEEGEEDLKKAAHASYDGFLKAAIRTYYDGGGDRVNFIALLLASREAWGVAWEEVSAPGTGKKLLTGAAGAAAVVFAIRMLLGGPVGIILTGASIASLGALYARNHKYIWAQQERYKTLMSEYRVKHQQVRGKFLEGIVDEDERDLMVDGLLRRFLAEIEEKPDLGEDEADDEHSNADEEE
ncbi:MAG: hypothetical protein AB8I08_15835 [Sandaracinaceae bacterium]